MLSCCWRNTAQTLSLPKVLVIGLEGAGKTLLVLQLLGLVQGKKTVQQHTMPTIGTDLQLIPASRGLLKSPIMLREVGGQMLPIWHEFYAEAAGVLYVVDTAKTALLAQSAIELFELLQHPSVKEKPVCVVFNNRALLSTVTLPQLNLAFQLAALAHIHPGGFSSIMASATTGQGTEQILPWLDQCHHQHHQNHHHHHDHHHQQQWQAAQLQANAQGIQRKTREQQPRRQQQCVLVSQQHCNLDKGIHMGDLQQRTTKPDKPELREAETQENLKEQPCSGLVKEALLPQQRQLIEPQQELQAMPGVPCIP